MQNYVNWLYPYFIYLHKKKKVVWHKHTVQSRELEFRKKIKIYYYIYE